jgi:hypothetical protein
MKSVIALLLLITLTIVGASPSNDSSIYILPVKNSIKMGSLSGNVNLTLGVKNILEEALMDKEFNLSSNAESSDYTLQAELIYFDILKTNSNISVFHKDNNETIIRMKGTLYKGDKKVKEIIVEESSSEISSSTLAISYDGSFNQQTARNAVKKTCIKLIETLTKK